MKVKLKKDINIKDLAENYWEGCQKWTLDFIKNYYGDDITFKAEEVIEGSYRIYGTGIDTDKDNEDLDYIDVNKKCFDIIEEDPEEDEITEWSNFAINEMKKAKNLSKIKVYIETIMRTQNEIIEKIKTLD